METQKTAESLYNILTVDRSSYERDGDDCAKLTIPSLFNNNSAKKQKIKTPFQALGAAGTNSLAAKMLMALIPPNTPFFKLIIDELELQKSGQSEIMAEIDKGLRGLENAVMADIETSNDRVAMFEALKHLIVVGNVLLYITEDGLKVYYLDRYVVQRDEVGNVLTIITKESVSTKALDPEFFEQIKQKENYDADSMEDAEIDIYTKVERQGNNHVWFQECRGEKIPGTDGISPVDVSPFIVLRWTQTDTNYGTSYVNEYKGDLISLEALMQAIIEGAAASARTVYFINPNGVTSAKAVSHAPNGAVREGLSTDVTTLQTNKGNDFAVAFQAKQTIEKRLEDAFLMTKSIQRDAERVTSTEIQIMSNALEATLGGIYSVLSSEFQIKYLRRKLHLLIRAGKAPKLPDKLVRPKIVTGINGLGRDADKQKLIEFIGTIAQALGVDVMRRYMNIDEAIIRLANSVGIETLNLIKSKEEIAQELQAEQQQQLLKDLAPSALQGHKLLDPKNQAEAQLLQNEVTPNANQQITEEGQQTV